MGWFLWLLLKKAGKDHLFISVKPCKIGLFITQLNTQYWIFTVVTHRLELCAQKGEARERETWMALWTMNECSSCMPGSSWLLKYTFTISVLFCWDLSEQKKPLRYVWNYVHLYFIVQIYMKGVVPVSHLAIHTSFGSESVH